VIAGPADSVKRARKLRSEMSLPEALLWRELRKRPGSFKFRRQHPAGVYILDFYCAALRLAIEVDGWGHSGLRSAKADATRSAFLRSQGVATVRVPAQAVLDDPGGAALRLVEICRERAERLSRSPDVPLHQPTAGPPPRSGEDS
jgi:very-short-patch-repair endonuclease